MPKITHIFFDLHGTLVDGVKLHPCYTENLARIMTERYGHTPDTWIKANRQVLDDWDSYYADLDLGGDDGIAHVYEGLYRTTRAMFRLAGTPEPPKSELLTLSRELPGLVTWTCDAFYPDVRQEIDSLCASGYTLGVATHALHEQARGLLHGAGVLECFAGPIIGADTAESYDKDRMYFLKAAMMAKTAPENCLLVDDVARYIKAAKTAGMRAVQVIRKENQTRSKRADFVLDGGLSGLIAALKKLQ